MYLENDLYNPEPYFIIINTHVYIIPSDCLKTVSDYPSFSIFVIHTIQYSCITPTSFLKTIEL